MSQTTEEYKTNLERQLWAVADILRGKMDANEYKNYILGFIFYKNLSEKEEKISDEYLRNDNTTFKELDKESELAKLAKKHSLKRLGYYIEPEDLFSNLVKKAENNDDRLIEDLEKALNKVSESAIQTKSESQFKNLFDDVDLDSSKLGDTEQKRNKIITQIILKLSDIDFELGQQEQDILGDAYEYLLGEFASEAGKKAGEFYTPQEVSKVLAKIVTLNDNGKTKKELQNVYDPTCGSGSLLLQIQGKKDKEGNYQVNVGNFYGQELNQTTYNLARMNMILHDINFEKFLLKQGDSLEDPLKIPTKEDPEPESLKKETCQAIVANPPFSAKWSKSKKFEEDPRFNQYVKNNKIQLAPKSKADYAFIEHMIYYLSNDGTMAVVVPHGVLFRGSAEGAIRESIIENNYLDTIIGLPANLFYGTSIEACILVFKKCKTNKDVLFIDASKEYKKVKNQNKLRKEDIDKIINTYITREEIPKYSHTATIEEIQENEYNLNIRRYVDTYEEKIPKQLTEIKKELKEINQKIKETDKDIEKYCKQLGIEAPTEEK